jgi:hypothetical protein
MIDETQLYDLNRRRHGLVIGLAAGFVFGLIANAANPLLLPGIPLYQPPFGWLGNTLLWMATGGLLGLISAWASSSVYGIVIGSLVAGLLLQLSSLLSSNLSALLGLKLIGVAGLFFPFAALASPLLMLLRWAANEQREWYQQRWFTWKRLRVPLVFLVATGGLALLWLIPPDGQNVLKRMNSLVQQGLQSGSPSSLPAALQDPLVGPFRDRATPGYSLEFSRQNLTRFQIPYAPQGDFQPAAAIARFSSQWTLVCLYVNPETAPFCKGFDNRESEVD